MNLLGMTFLSCINEQNGLVYMYYMYLYIARCRNEERLV
jgi:hypothetical protein